jgi:hypothetical protein
VVPHAIFILFYFILFFPSLLVGWLGWLAGRCCQSGASSMALNPSPPSPFQGLKVKPIKEPFDPQKKHNP